MPSEYEIRIDTSIDPDGVSSFVSQVTEALQEIRDKADAAQKSGNDTSGFRSNGVQRLRTQAEGAIAGSGLSEGDQKRYLQEMGRVFDRHAQEMRRIVPNYRQNREVLRDSQGRPVVVGDVARKRDRDPAYEDLNEEGITAVERASRAKRNSALFNTLAAQDPDYRKAALAEAIGLKGTNTAYNKTLAESPEYKQAYGDNETSQKLREATENAALSTKKFADANAAAATSALELRVQLDAAKTGSAEYIEAEVQTAIELKARQAKLAEAKASDDDYAKWTGQAAAGMAALKAKEAEAIAATDSYIDDAKTKLANTRNARNTTQAVLEGTSEDDLSQQGAIDAASARQRVTVAYQKLSSTTEDDIQAAAQLKVAQQEYREALNKAVAEITGTSGSGGKGTLFQRFQSRNDPGGGDPTSKRTLGQFIGSHAANTLGYAVPGLAFGVGIEELTQSVQEAEKAQRTFAELQAQFTALGEAGQFAGFKSSIEDISNSTGVAVSEVTELGMAMKGVYGSTAQAEIALKGVAEAAVAMGLDTQEAQQDLTAVTQSFVQLQTQGGKAIQEVSNEMLHLQDLTGVDAKNILQGTADAAASTSQLGIGYKTTSSLVAAASERSGLPTDTIGQTLSKVADGLAQNYQQIYSVYQSDPNLRGASLQRLNQDTPDQRLTQILSDFRKMGSGERLQIESSLGVNASAMPAVNALVEGAQKGARLARTNAPENRTADEFKLQMDTLNGAFEKLRQQVVNVGVELLDSGFGTSLVDMANAAGSVVGAFGHLNKDTDGLAGKFVEFGAAVLVANVGLKALGAGSAFIRGIKSLGDSSDAAAAANERNVVATDANAAANARNAEATTVDAAANVRNAEANSAGLLSRVGSGATGFLGANVVGEGAAFGTPQILAVGASAIAGYGIGGEALKESRSHSLVGDADRYAITDPVQGVVRAEFNLLGQNGPNPNSFNQGTYTAKQMGAMSTEIQLLINDFKQLHSLLTPQQQAIIAAWEKDPTNIGLYHKAQQVFTSSNVGNSSAGQSILAADRNAPSANSPAVQEGEDNLIGAHGAAEGVKAAANKQKELTDKAAQQQREQIGDYQGISTAYAAGAVSFGTLLTSANDAIAAAQKAYDNQKSGGSYAEYEALQTAISNKNTILDQLVTQQTQETQSLAQTGNVQSDQENIQRLTSSIGKLKTPAAMLTTAQGIVSAMQTQVQDEANMATSLSAQQKILEDGVTASASELAAYNKAQKANGLATVSSLTIRGQAESPSSRLAALQQVSQAQAAQAVASAHEDPVAVAAANYNASLIAVANDLKSGYGPGTPQYQQDQATAAEDWQTLADSQNQVKEATLQLKETTAQAANNAVGAAQAAYELAQQQLADAHGLAAQEAAQGAMAMAAQQQEQAVISLLQAKGGLVTALLSEQGKPVQAAYETYQTALKAAAAQASYDKAHGTNPQQDATYLSDVQQAYAAQSSWLQEQVSNLESIGETEVFLGQQTDTQYIAQLEAELTKVKGNKVLTEQILQEIRQVQNSAGGSLDFDIPTNLLVSPTLYQAERTSQFSGGYSGNNTTNQNVTININGGNPSRVVAAVGNALGSTGSTAGTLTPTPLISSR